MGAVSYTHLDVYKRQVHNRAAETITVTPAKVIVVAGILIFAEPELRERLDIKLLSLIHISHRWPDTPC